MKPILESILGFALFPVLSILAALVTRNTPYQTRVPLIFIVLAALVAFFVGRAAAYAGLFSSAIVFAMMLFEPLGSWHVSGEAARVNLAWMLMGGMAAAFIFARPGDTPKKQQ